MGQIPLRVQQQPLIPGLHQLVDQDGDGFRGSSEVSRWPPSSGPGLPAPVGLGMVPEGLRDQFQPPRPAGLPVLPGLGLEPGYRLPVQGDGHPLDEAVLQGLLLPHRPLAGLGEEFLGGLGIGPGLFGSLVCVRVLGQLGGDLRLLLRIRPDEVKLSLVSNAPLHHYTEAPHTGESPPLPNGLSAAAPLPESRSPGP